MHCFERIEQSLASKNMQGLCMTRAPMSCNDKGSKEGEPPPTLPAGVANATTSTLWLVCLANVPDPSHYPCCAEIPWQTETALPIQEMPPVLALSSVRLPVGRNRTEMEATNICIYIYIYMCVYIWSNYSIYIYIYIYMCMYMKQLYQRWRCNGQFSSLSSWPRRRCCFLQQPWWQIWNREDTVQTYLVLWP